MKRIVSCSLALLACSCAVDERKLELGMGARAGDTGASLAGEAGASTGGSSAGSSGNGGSAGEGGGGPGCADLDTDGVADCEATLLQNASFTDDVSSWAAQDDADLSWSSKNSFGASASGSGKLSATAMRARATQCVPLEGQQLVIVYGSAFIEPNDAAEGAEALIEVSFFEQADCGGERDRYFETPPSTTTGKWVTIHAGQVTRPETKSISIDLVGNRTQTSGELTLYFDDLLLKIEPLDL